MMTGNAFARLACVVVAISLPSAFGGGEVINIEGEEGLHVMNLSPHNKMVMVEMLQEGEHPNPAFDYSARMLHDVPMTFARIQLSHPGNSKWFEAAAESTIAAKILPAEADTPEWWLGFCGVPEDEEAALQIFYRAYREHVVIPHMEAAMSVMTSGANKELDKGRETVVVKGIVETKMFGWVTRLATMTDDKIFIDPIEGMTAFFGTQEVISMEGKTVVEGCNNEKDGGCFSIYHEADIKDKKKKPVAQLRVSDPREAETWVRYAHEQKKNKQMSSGKPSSSSDVTVIEMSPTLLVVGDSKSSVDCIADVNVEDMNHLGLKHGNTVTLRGGRRDRQQEVLVVSGDSEPSNSIGINERLRKALGVGVGGLVTLVQDKAYPVILPPSANSDDMQQQATDHTTSKHSFGSLSDTVPIASDSLYPSSPPLVLGCHLSSACSQDDDFYDPAGLGKTVDSPRVCLYPTDKGSVCITRGDEPRPDQKPLWEAGGRGAPKGRRLRGFFGGVARRSTKGGDEKDGKDLAVEDVAVCVRHGRLVVGRSGNGDSVVDVTYKSPRPRGWWKAYLARFSRTGREIRDSALKLSPEGRVTMETEDGNVLWEVDLPAAGQEDVCLMA